MNASMPRAAQGAVLITALFIMTLVAIAATSMSMRLQIDIYRTNLMLNADKAYLASQTPTTWAVAELKAGLSKKKSRNDILPRWTLPLPFPARKYPYPQAKIKGVMEDLQAYFNLNNLSDKKAIPGFIHFLKTVLPKLNQQQRQDIAIAIHDWLVPITPGKTRQNKFYGKQHPPYFAAHQFMTSKTELKLIAPINDTIYNAIEPYVMTAPDTTPININTAKPEVLYNLGLDINEQQINKIIQERGKDGFTDKKILNKLLQDLNINNKNITVDSHYFLVKSVVTIGAQSIVTYTKIHAELSKKNDVVVSIISESINTL